MKWSRLSLLFLVAVFLVGCQGRSVVSTYYLWPEWTKDGKVTCLKGIREQKYSNINSKIADDYGEYLTYMYAEGTGETVGTNVTSDIASSLKYNPYFNMVAYASGVGGGEFNRIVVMYFPPTSEARAERIELAVPHAVDFDWDNTGSRVVWCNTSGEIHIITLSGTDTLLVDVDAKTVSWKYGTKIIFTYLDGTTNKVAKVDADGNNRDNFGIADFSCLNVSDADKNEVYGVKGGAYMKINLNTKAESTAIASFTGNNPRLASTGDKIVFEKDESLYTQDFSGATSVKIK
jgi:hypothetical protein